MTKIFVLIGTAIAGFLTVAGIISKRAEAKGYKKLSDDEIDSNNKEIEELETKKEAVKKTKTTAKKTVATKKQKVNNLEAKKKAPIKRKAPAKKNLKGDIVAKTARKPKAVKK